MNERDMIGGEAPQEADAWIRRPWIRGEVKCISGEKLAHDLNKPIFRRAVKCRRFSRCITLSAPFPNNRRIHMKVCIYTSVFVGKFESEATCFISLIHFPAGSAGGASNQRTDHKSVSRVSTQIHGIRLLHTYLY